jgi:hypothetical protein
MTRIVLIITDFIFPGIDESNYGIAYKYFICVNPPNPRHPRSNMQNQVRI